MTETALKKRIEYFAGRMEATRDHRDTPQGKRAYTLARNCWRQARRQLLCRQDTGSIMGWTKYKLEDHEQG